MMEENHDKPMLPPGREFPNWEIVNEESSEVSTEEIPTEARASAAGPMSPPPFQPAPISHPQPSHKGFVVGAAVTAVAVLLGAGLGHQIWPSTTHASSSGGSNSSGSFQIPSSGGSSSAPSTHGTTSAAALAVASKVSPSLVDINTNLGYRSSQAAGTGIVLSSSGLVLTNNHVIDGATQISATDVGNGKTYTAKVVGYDRTADVAVIQLQSASGLTVANFGNSKTVSVGQSVIGIGNAGGSGGTPSTAEGTVTALNQSITASDESSANTEQLSGLIETNAPIQPGDSGGPLVTMEAQVIGMDTAASSNFAFSQGGSQGYAIPVNTALSIAKQIEAGQVSDAIHIGQTGFLGVEVQPASSGRGFTNPFGSGSSGSSATGVTVVGTVSGSPAENAGLAQGDVITALNGTTITTPAQLTAGLGRFHPGDSVTLSWTDPSGNSHSAQITLENGPAA
jgi:S1-C subfamily serine protease